MPLTQTEGRALVALAVFGSVFDILLGGALVLSGLIVGILGLSDAYPLLTNNNLSSTSVEAILLLCGGATAIVGITYILLAVWFRNQSERAWTFGPFIVIASAIVSVISTIVFGWENMTNVIIATVLLIYFSRGRAKRIVAKPEARLVTTN